MDDVRYVLRRSRDINNDKSTSRSCPSIYLDQEEEMNIPRDLSNDEDDYQGIGEHCQARADVVRVLAPHDGRSNLRTDDRREVVLWAMVAFPHDLNHLANASPSIHSFVVDNSSTSPDIPTLAGLVHGLIAIITGEVKILSLWLCLYPSDIQQNLAEINAACIILLPNLSV